MKFDIQTSVGLALMFVGGFAYAAQAQTSVASQGETVVTSEVQRLTVQAKIKTHEVQIGLPSDERPTVIESNCTYSKYPCSIVDRLDITVNGRPLFVPRSVFTDLADLTKAEVTKGKRRPVLTLYGGDASEGYIVKIEFDSTQVLRRTLSSTLTPATPLQETTYHLQEHDPGL